MSKNRWLAAVGAVSLAALGLTALLRLVPPANAQGHPGGMEPPRERQFKGDVVLIACDATGSFTVLGYQGSPGTPAKKSSNCAENLALLAKDGFIARDIGHSLADKSGVVVYTLLR